MNQGRLQKLTKQKNINFSRRCLNIAQDILKDPVIQFNVGFFFELKRYSISITWLLLSDGKLKSLKLNYKYKDLILQVNIMNSKADYFYYA